MSTMLVRSAARVGRNNFAKTKSTAYSHSMSSVRAGSVYGGANQSLGVAPAAAMSARGFSSGSVAQVPKVEASTSVMDGRARATRELEFQRQDLADGFSSAHAELYEIGYTNPAGALNHPDISIRNEALKRLSVKPAFASKPELLFRRNGSTHTLLEDVQRGLMAESLAAQVDGENVLPPSAREGEMQDLLALQGMGGGSLMKTSQVSLMGAAPTAGMQRTFSGGLSEYIEFLDSSPDAKREEAMSYSQTLEVALRSAAPNKLKDFARTYSQSLVRTNSTTSLFDNNNTDSVDSKNSMGTIAVGSQSDESADTVEYQGLLNKQLTKTLALKAGTPEHEAHMCGVEKKNPNLFARRVSGFWFAGGNDANPAFEAEREETRRMALGLNNTIEKQDGDGWMGSAAGFLLFGYLGLFVLEDIRFWTSSLILQADRAPKEFVRR